MLLSLSFWRTYWHTLLTGGLVLLLLGTCWQLDGARERARGAEGRVAVLDSTVRAQHAVISSLLDKRPAVVAAGDSASAGVTRDIARVKGSVVNCVVPRSRPQPKPTAPSTTPAADSAPVDTASSPLAADTIPMVPLVEVLPLIADAQRLQADYEALKALDTRIIAAQGAQIDTLKTEVATLKTEVQHQKRRVLWTRLKSVGTATLAVAVVVGGSLLLGTR